MGWGGVESDRIDVSSVAHIVGRWRDPTLPGPRRRIFLYLPMIWVIWVIWVIWERKVVRGCSPTSYTVETKWL